MNRTLGGEAYNLCATSHIILRAHLAISVVEHVHRNAGIQFVTVEQIHDAQYLACQRRKLGTYFTPKQTNRVVVTLFV